MAEHRVVAGQWPLSNVISIGKRLCTSLMNFANNLLDRMTYLNEMDVVDYVVHPKKSWVEGIIAVENTLLIICHNMDDLCWFRAIDSHKLCNSVRLQYEGAC